jgi:hypothetical protein
MKVVPITIKEANKIVGDHHRHNNPTGGGKFAIGAEHDGRLVGAVIVGRPIARLLDNPGSAEITRLVVTPNAPRNTCSFLYGAARRVWQAMGGQKILTYTLKQESGDSLRGAGWNKAADCKPATWTRPNRERKDQAVYRNPKIRWEAACV